MNEERHLRDRPAGGPAEDGRLARSSGVMAVGTVLSRALGFVRNMVIAAAIGTAVVADTYNLANAVPNVLFTLLAGGVLNAVFVPQLVRAMTSGEREGRAYADRLLTLSLLVLAGVTVLATLAAPLVVRVYAGGEFSTRDVTNATLFAYWFLPQIFFYGLYTMLGQILNARGSFGPMMWTPILNNVVVIATGLLFIVVAAADPGDSASLSTGEVTLLGAGTTLGIVVQAVALVPVLARTGYRWRPRLDVRGAGLGRVGTLAKWTVAYVAVNQLAYLVVVRLTTDAGKLLAAERDFGAGFTPYQYAYLMFLLPHSIVTVSVVTAVLPRMSRAAAAGRLDSVRRDVSQGLRLVAVAVVPASLVFFLMGPELGTTLFSFGAASGRDGRYVGLVLSGFALGLVPFSAHHLVLRGFYAQEDTRTPFFLACLVAALDATFAVTAFLVLPVEWKTVGIAAGYALAYTVGVAVSAATLRRRIGGLDGARVLRTYVRLAVAALLAALVGLLALRLVRIPDPDAWWSAALGLAVGASVTAAGYVWLARRMRVSELTDLLAQIGGPLARRLGR